MKKTVAQITALTMAAAMALTACGTGGKGTENGGAADSDKNAIKDLVTYEAPNREQEGFFILRL